MKTPSLLTVILAAVIATLFNMSAMAAEEAATAKTVAMPPPTAIHLTTERVTQAQQLYQTGQRSAARDAAISAHVDAFEFAESALHGTNPTLTETIEDKLGQLASLTSEPDQQTAIDSLAAELNELLEEDALPLVSAGTLNAVTGGFSAFVILMREGVEAMLVLAAIIGFLTKADKRGAIKYVHTGWSAALICGAITWLAATHFLSFSGTDREFSEGVTALIAAAMLVYVGYWLHSNSYAQRWKSFLHEKLGNAAAQTALWPFIAISFFAVYREIFETILFLQTLWLQIAVGHRFGLFVGLGAAVVALATLGWMVFRFSVRLPLRFFFNANAVLLFALAIVFVGKGIAALQEAGSLPTSPLPFPQVNALGIYPTAQSLMAQATIITLGIVAVLFTRHRLLHRRK